MKSTLTFITALAATAIAAPVAIEERQAGYDAAGSSVAWNAGATNEWRIHASCNASQVYQLRAALDETVELARHAKEHALQFGNASDIYVKYFGDNPAHEVIGAFDIIVSGDKANALFRCDDPDRNCQNMPTWAGHWRGNNATDETVICPPSFFNRRYLATMCARGYNVRQSPTNTFWASDLVHRLYHMPAFGQWSIEHYTEGYDELLEQAEASSSNSTRDSDGLQYFALEAYAHDIIQPGVGCPGPVAVVSSSMSRSMSMASTSQSASMASASSATAVAASTTQSVSASMTSAAAASTSSLPANCHTHANGDVHCT